MDVYLPIAGLSVNILVIILLGGAVGMLSGMFGVGGGFLTTPLLIFYGIPPIVAAASASTQVTGTSVSGVLAHMKRGGVDFRMGAVLVAGGLLGTLFGALLFRVLEAWGQIDTVINILYVVMLGGIGGVMMRESVQAVLATRAGKPLPASKRRHHPLVANLPWRWRFYRSGLYISPLAPLILGMSANVVVGTSLFQILFVTMSSTIVHSLTTKAVDIVLAVFLLIGSVTGAQIGARLAQRMKPEYLRLFLASIVLLVAIRMALGLGWRPDEIYTVQLL